jgi:hypothetical protein
MALAWDGLRRRWVAFASILALSVAYTAFLIWLSTKLFRLSGFPVNDDVYYFDEGLKILKSLRADGVLGLLGLLRQHPLHSPLASLGTALVFGLFGVHDWLPYTTNVWMVAAMLLFWREVCRRLTLPGGARLCLLILVLSSPLLVRSVIVYQPVFPSAVAATLGSLAFLDGWPAQSRGARRWLAAAFWVLALLYKPTVSPQVAVNLFAAAVLGVWALRRAGEPLALTVRRYALNAGLIAVVVLPHFLVAARHLYDYILFGTFHVPERFFLDAGGVLLFHLTGPGGALMLGGTIYILVALVLGWAVLLRRSPRPGERLFFASLMGLTVLNYVICTGNPYKQEYLGPPFQYLLLAAAVIGAGRVAAFVWLRVSLRAGFAALTMLAVPVSTQVPYLDPWAQGNWAERKAIMAGLVSTLHQAGAREGQRLFLTTSGFISVTSLSYQLAKPGWSVPDIFDYAFDDKLEDSARAIHDSDWVVASTPGHPEVIAFHTSTRFAADTLRLAREDPGLRLVGRVGLHPGQDYFVFRRDR